MPREHDRMPERLRGERYGREDSEALLHAFNPYADSLEEFELVARGRDVKRLSLAPRARSYAAATVASFLAVRNL